MLSSKQATSHDDDGGGGGDDAGVVMRVLLACLCVSLGRLELKLETE